MSYLKTTQVQEHTVHFNLFEAHVVLESTTIRCFPLPTILHLPKNTLSTIKNIEKATASSKLLSTYI